MSPYEFNRSRASTGELLTWVVYPRDSNIPATTSATRASSSTTRPVFLKTGYLPCEMLGGLCLTSQGRMGRQILMMPSRNGLFNHREPWASLTIRVTVASPSPVPPELVV